MDGVRQLQAVVLVEQRFVVEEVLLRRTASLEQVDYPLHTRVKLQRRCIGSRRTGCNGRVVSGCKQRTQGNTANPAGRVAEEVAPGKPLHVFGGEIVSHG